MTAGPEFEPTSLTLLGRAKLRDPEAWRRLVRLYSPAMFAWAKRAGLQDDDAADVVQDTWAAVSAKLDSFEKDAATGTFRGWLWTVTRNKVRDLGRKRADSAHAAGGTAMVVALANVPAVEPDDETATQSAGMVQRALDLIRPDFEDRTWKAFWGLAVVGRPAKDVGEDLGLAANAVHQAKFRVLKRLREELTALGVADDPTFAAVLPGA